LPRHLIASAKSLDIFENAGNLQLDALVNPVSDVRAYFESTILEDTFLKAGTSRGTLGSPTFKNHFLVVFQIVLGCVFSGVGTSRVACHDSSGRSTYGFPRRAATHAHQTKQHRSNTQ